MSGTRGLGLFARMVQSFGFALERRFGEAYRNASGYRKLGKCPPPRPRPSVRYEMTCR